jgi:hypothetical protein
MPFWAWIVIVVVAALVVLALISASFRTRRSRRLQQGFGPEYDRTVERAGGKRAGEKELIHRRNVTTRSTFVRSPRSHGSATCGLGT